MGANRWPIETCRTVFGDIEALCRAASKTANRMDGAVVASIDGVLLERMVRIKDPSRQLLATQNDSAVVYEDWMGRNT